MPLNVILVEGSAVVRQRLVELLDGEADIVIIGQYEDAATAIDRIRDGDPHGVLLDGDLREGGGRRVMLAIAAESPYAKMIILSHNAEPQYCKHYLAAGAMVVLDKAFEFNRIPGLLRELTCQR